MLTWIHVSYMHHHFRAGPHTLYQGNSVKRGKVKFDDPGVIVGIWKLGNPLSISLSLSHICWQQVTLNLNQTLSLMGL